MGNIEINTKLSGEYRLVVTSANGVVNDAGWFPNLIVNRGLDMMGNSTNPIAYASVGTGVSVPSPSHTSLDAPIAYSSPFNYVSGLNSGSPSYETRITYAYTFAPGATMGDITEVGVGATTTAGNLFSRALILDHTGHPTSITLTSADQLTVYYRITVAPPLTDVSGSIILNSVSYNYTVRILAAGTFANNQNTMTSYFSTIYSATTFAAGAVVAPITSAYPTGVSSGAPALVKTNSYIPASYQQVWTATWSPSAGNAPGGIQALKIVAGGPAQSMIWQVVFDIPIPKTDIRTLFLTFRFSWGRL